MSLIVRDNAVFNSVFVRFLFNYFSSIFLIFLGYVFYTQLSVYHVVHFYHHWQPQFGSWKPDISVTTASFFRGFLFIYAVVLLLYFLINSGADGKSSVAVRAVFKKLFPLRFGVASHDDNQALFSVLLKFFFVPFILDAFLGHVSQINYRLSDLYIWLSMDRFDRPFFIPDITRLYFEIALSLVYLFDIVPFVVGYLVESRYCDNKIKSVESTWAGWVFCLCCYPPFNTAFGAFFRTDYAEYVAPFAESMQYGFYLQIALNFSALILLAMYASVSVSLGCKASNLTSRGVVTTGLFKYVRHPAYACKNAAWWLFAIGAAIHLHSQARSFLVPLAGLAVWTWIYYNRALTEELHMARTDPEYLAYMKEVPRRFVPKIFNI